MPEVFRVVNPNSPTGLWYDKDGRWNPIIIGIEGKAAHLPMGYDPNMRLNNEPWLSATVKEEELLDWFSVSDMHKLGERGYGIWKFEVTGYREVPGHVVIQPDAVLVATRIPLMHFLTKHQHLITE